MSLREAAKEIVSATRMLSGAETIYDVSDDEKVWERYWEAIQLAAENGLLAEEAGEGDRDLRKAIREVAKDFEVNPREVKDNVEDEMRALS